MTFERTDTPEVLDLMEALKSSLAREERARVLSEIAESGYATTYSVPVGDAVAEELAGRAVAMGVRLPRKRPYLVVGYRA